MESIPTLPGIMKSRAISDKFYSYGCDNKPFTYGILPDINGDDQAEYKYGAKKINLEEKCGGFAAVSGQDVMYQVNYIIDFLHDFFT